jgi:hypothetical protein
MGLAGGGQGSNTHMDHRRLRRFFARPAAFAVAALAVAVAACGVASPAAQQNADPYQLASKSFDASWDQVKLQLGFTTTGSSQDISLKPEAIQLSLDTKAGKGALHLSIPKSALGPSAAQLTQLGVTGDNLDIDVLFDGQALYAKSPIASTLLPMLMAQMGQTVTGDLTGWLKLGTAQDFAGLAGSLSNLPQASMPAASSFTKPDPATLKTRLEQAGVGLTYVGSEQRNGVNADHVAIAIDINKFASSEFASQMPAGQLESFKAAASKGTMSGDVWLDKASGRPSELDLHVAENGGAKADVTLLIGSPDASAFATPGTATDVPITPMLTTLMQTFGGSITP